MHVSFKPADIQPLIEEVVQTTVAQLQADHATLGDRLAFPEPEAAALLGVRPHILRDARLRGELVGCRVGKKVLYEREELLRFLRQQRRARGD